MNILPLYENLTPIEQIESLKVNFSYILTEIIAIFFEIVFILGQKESISIFKSIKNVHIKHSVFVSFLMT